MKLTMALLKQAAAAANLSYWGVGCPADYRQEAARWHYEEERQNLERIAGFDPELMLAFGLPYEVGQSVSVEAVPGVLENHPVGVVSPMAFGQDYHRQLHERAALFVAAIKGRLSSRGENLEVFVCIDTTPLADRIAAGICGMGSPARSGFLMHPDLGTAWNIGVILLRGEDAAELAKSLGEEDGRGNLGKPPLEKLDAHCINCQICQKACPTGAISEHGGIDAERCLSAVTQRRGRLTEEEMTSMGQRLYGCDVCQRVCPANRQHTSFIEDPKLDLLELLSMTKSDFRVGYGEMGFYWRGLGVLKRNALIALGNAVASGAAKGCEVTIKSSTDDFIDLEINGERLKLHQNLQPWVERLIEKCTPNTDE